MQFTKRVLSEINTLFVVTYKMCVIECNIIMTSQIVEKKLNKRRFLPTKYDQNKCIILPNKSIDAAVWHPTQQKKLRQVGRPPFFNYSTFCLSFSVFFYLLKISYKTKSRVSLPKSYGQSCYRNHTYLFLSFIALTRIYVQYDIILQQWHYFDNALKQKCQGSAQLYTVQGRKKHTPSK